MVILFSCCLGDIIPCAACTFNDAEQSTPSLACQVANYEILAAIPYSDHTLQYSIVQLAHFSTGYTVSSDVL